MKSLWISELRDSGQVQGTFLVADVDVRAARDGNPYVRLKLQDRTGTIDAIRWKASDREQQVARASDYLHIEGRLDSYQGRPQIVLDHISQETGPVDPADFLRTTDRDPDAMAGELAGIAATVVNPQVRALLSSLSGDTPLGRDFRQAPGALKVHHAYIGGLLEHTLSAVKLADALAEHYPQMNRDLLIAGTMLHDVGKTQEYLWQSRISQSDEGLLLGHITQGVLMVNRLMDEIPGFDPQWRMLLTHMIVSHHGKLEFGSPRVPMFPEAVALHYIEDMDAKLEIMASEIADTQSQGTTERWTGYVKYLESQIFRGVPENGCLETAADEADVLTESASDGGAEQGPLDDEDPFA